jgi:hypothetical protein
LFICFSKSPLILHSNKKLTADILQQTNMESGIILSSSYLPSIQYYVELLRCKGAILIEAMEHYPKQTYRNRAVIYTANGPLLLSIPIKKGSGEHTLTKEVRISNDHPWQRMHWMSIETAYRSSAYFEFYEEELRPFYEKKYDLLIDFNTELFEYLNKLLKLELLINFTTEYTKHYPLQVTDFRNTFDPRTTPLITLPILKPYYQVFSEKHGFIPNLSIIDLIFNCGPDSKKYLKDD